MTIRSNLYNQEDRITASVVGDHIRALESDIDNPKFGLPEEVFLLVSRLTPLVNVDLLIRNRAGEILLTWRDDQIFGQGWHIPGGCIRLGETFSDRIAAVAETELGVTVTVSSNPISICETIDNNRPSRTHHITLLFECQLDCEPLQSNRYEDDHHKPGTWAWHANPPENLLQREYRTWFSESQSSRYYGGAP